MFTGIVRDIGVVRSAECDAGGMRAVIAAGWNMEAVTAGDSIACSGCCLTVTDKGGDWFSVDISGETLSKTTLGRWREGTPVNLETSLRMGEKIGGHLVSGHVDGCAVVEDIRSDGESRRFRFRVPDLLAPYVATKGSVAIDGVSLTVNETQGSVFGINVIPYTWKHTTFQNLSAGDSVNLEVDLLARYVARMLGKEG